MYSAVRSILFRMSAERAHEWILAALSRAPAAAGWFAPRVRAPESLAQTVLGLPFAHPIGLAAGLDKNGVAIPAWYRMGFSFVEIGTVTPRPQPGNPKPRLFRLIEDEALINRMGFNNEGARAVARRLEQIRQLGIHGILGINIGKNKATPNELAHEDYLLALEQVAPFADYLTINVSSPNTPGLRDLQSESFMLDLLKAIEPIRSRHSLPLWIKLAPDLPNDEIERIVDALATSPFRAHLGLICTNTTIERPPLSGRYRDETGGLSGRPLAARSTEVVRIASRAAQKRLPIIGSGGVFTAEDAYEKIRSGASLVQIYTALIYRGPAVVGELVRGLDELLARDGFANVGEAVGIDVKG
ncbi:quinone-dependent dihydroorotate dehydrogenase [Alicyclobacillus mali]|uniref:Dihydroorotate dehydrogenase (quinone) n=1 Tax=Alicyclobacillus mali (ex Roth et al. 2021) TaxID=1123961 RepID=A0ABS0F123_9BACL|nr:quinone-dependent dihydroorotate dehydrogenase [Alicyclobacillus mali (ex Roth et al. 2021)]MBF8376989.1 quinone-dependent dihydroorotate dehydrogenase [Alicyclobacillus mali (ex Roth et al. 2021)]MCL6489029.1 quinone-dependent dihydroorotate dehydrogenase [Alicyclobacillus mali (ex Roth et al. 2021)]